MGGKMKRVLLTAMLLWSCAAFAQNVMPKTVSQYAPSQIIPASEKTTQRAISTKADSQKKSARRARSPRQRRMEGKIPGLVTIPYGKTASGKRTHIYRIMGQGGVVADFTDYGARLLRLYAPDAAGEIENIVVGGKRSVIECEKAGDIADVWKMTAFRRPRATGLMFELKEAKETKATKGTNGVPPKVVYWLDAGNKLTVESTIADTNAVKWASSVKLAPLKARPLSVATPTGMLSLSSTTNITEILLRPATNAVQRTELRFEGIKLK
jgi:hypothetical protein